jgi:hypothetical protein
MLSSNTAMRANLSPHSADLQFWRGQGAPGTSTHLLTQGPVNKELTRSFAELDLFGEQGNLVARFMKDLHDRPFETTLTAFSKLTGVVASGINGSLRPYEEEAEGSKPSTTVTGTSPPTGEEYEVIGSEAENAFSLPPRYIMFDPDIVYNNENRDKLSTFGDN